MKTSEILRRAARLIQDYDETFSCLAVAHAEVGDRQTQGYYTRSPAVRAYLDAVGVRADVSQPHRCDLLQHQVHREPAGPLAARLQFLKEAAEFYEARGD